MSNRRDFLKTVGTLGIGASIVNPLDALAINSGEQKKKGLPNSQKTIISLLQTTDVHCQIHPHDELFWENNKAVYRKTGGYAYITSMLRDLKLKNPNTFTIDTGDMFQGSELSVKTTGKAFAADFKCDGL